MTNSNEILHGDQTRQRQVWLIPIADERVGVQVKLLRSLETRAIPERFCGGVSRYIKCTYLYFYLLDGREMITVLATPPLRWTKVL